MRKLLTLLLVTSFSISSFAGGGCAAQPLIFPIADYCWPASGTCRVIAAIGSGETTQCINNIHPWKAECYKYAADGTLLVYRIANCIVF